MKFIGHQVGRILRFFQDKTGVSAIEYALIVVAVVGVVGAGFAILTDEFEDIFESAQTELKEASELTHGDPEDK